jgi:MFS family permease
MELTNLTELMTLLTTISVGGIGIGALVSFFTNAIKEIFPEKIRPFLPYLIGVIFAFLILGFSTIGWTILAGLFIGAFATGEYRYVNPVEP